MKPIYTTDGWKIEYFPGYPLMAQFSQDGEYPCMVTADYCAVCVVDAREGRLNGNAEGVKPCKHKLMLRDYEPEPLPLKRKEEGS